MADRLLKQGFFAFSMLFFGTASWAKIDPTACAPAALDRKNCILHRGSHRIQFRDDTMNSFDGVNRQLVKIPLVGEAVQWESVRWLQVGGRQFIELKIWEAPKTEGELSALFWIIYEVKGVQLDQKLKKLVQHRKALAGKNGFEKDKPVPHLMKFENKQVVWKHGFQTGVIK